MYHLECFTHHYTVETIISSQSHHYTVTGYRVAKKPPSYRYKISYLDTIIPPRYPYSNNLLSYRYKISYRHCHRDTMSRKTVSCHARPLLALVRPLESVIFVIIAYRVLLLLQTLPGHSRHAYHCILCTVRMTPHTLSMYLHTSSYYALSGGSSARSPAYYVPPGVSQQRSFTFILCTVHRRLLTKDTIPSPPPRLLLLPC